MAEALFLRRIGRGPGTLALERIAAVLNLTVQIAGRSTCTAEIFESVVVGLEVVISDAPILNGHVVGKEARAIAFGQMCSQHEIAGKKAPGLRIPVDPAAANSVGRHERTPAADR